MSDHLRTQVQSRILSDPAQQKKPGFLHRLVLAPFEGRQRRKAINQLERLDDRMLADIGILRSEIPQVIDGLSSQYAETACLRTLVAAPECRSTATGGSMTTTDLRQRPHRQAIYANRSTENTDL